MPSKTTTEQTTMVACLLRSGKRKRVPALAVCGALAVTPIIDYDTLRVRDDLFVMTHIPTGRRMGSYLEAPPAHVGDLILVMESLAGELDWGNVSYCDAHSEEVKTAVDAHIRMLDELAVLWEEVPHD